MTNYEKLNALFANNEYIEKIKGLDNIDGIYEAVVAEIPEVTKEELTAFLTAISERMHTGEISEDELENVSGGFGWAALGAGIVVAGGVVALINGFYDMGEHLGKFIGNLTK